MLNLIRFTVLLVTIGLQPLAALWAEAGYVVNDQIHMACCEDDCPCSIEMGCPCIEQEQGGGPTWPVAPASERLVVDQLFDTDALSSYPLEPLTEQTVFFDRRISVVPSSVGGRLSLLCVWLT